MRVLLAALLGGLATELMQTLPSDDKEAGLWIAGFCWAFAVFIALLLLVTMGWALQHGVAL